MIPHQRRDVVLGGHGSSEDQSWKQLAYLPFERVRREMDGRRTLMSNRRLPAQIHTFQPIDRHSQSRGTRDVLQ